MSTTDIGGKAKSLTVLKAISGVSVPPFTVMPASLSDNESEAVIGAFLRANPNVREVAVRSSAANEDCAHASFAGMYATKLRVPAEKQAILAAAQDVRAHERSKKDVSSHYTMTKGLRASESQMSVIIQQMVDADFSGVAFSHSLHERDGYYLISLARGLGEAVASGAVNGQLIRVARATDSAHIRETWLAELIETMKRLERHLCNESLDVEFAFKDGTLHVLQCRPLTAVGNGTAVEEQRLAVELARLNDSVAEQFRGDVLGDMIDINPAELLGASPSKLDISIFGHLFADSVVERVRRDMGYDPLDVGLIQVVYGKPYVSLRASAFSFRPRGISRQVYEKMCAVYRNMLASDPGLQSRVEFDVFAMREGDKLEHIMEVGRLTATEKSMVRSCFRRLDEALTPLSDDCRASFARWIGEYRDLERVNENDLQKLLDTVVKGTEWFVRVARLAFYWKNKFEELHPGEDLNELLKGHIVSASSRLQADMRLCAEGRLGRDELIARFGHLRPGQFSVFGESYADDPEHYLFGRLDSVRPQHVEKCVHAFEDTAEFRNVVGFMQAREETKFLFSRSFGRFVEALKVALARAGISHADASNCDWQELKTILDERRLVTARPQDRLPMILPDVIIPEVSDFRVIVSGTAAPSYITRAVIKARICVLDSPSADEDLKGAIALIPNADPGYDFLFHSGVVGIVTKNGGPASHMCIRAVELQMPSCIGCGAQVYDALTSASVAILDCQSRQIILHE